MSVLDRICSCLISLTLLVVHFLCRSVVCARYPLFVFVWVIRLFRFDHRRFCCGCCNHDCSGHSSFLLEYTVCVSLMQTACIVLWLVILVCKLCHNLLHHSSPFLHRSFACFLLLRTHRFVFRLCFSGKRYSATLGAARYSPDAKSPREVRVCCLVCVVCALGRNSLFVVLVSCLMLVVFVLLWDDQSVSLC